MAADAASNDNSKCCSTSQATGDRRGSSQSPAFSGARKLRPKAANGCRRKMAAAIDAEDLAQQQQELLEHPSAFERVSREWRKVAQDTQGVWVVPGPVPASAGLAIPDGYGWAAGGGRW